MTSQTEPRQGASVVRVALFVLVAGLAVGPVWWHQLDVRWLLAWAEASDGHHPAQIYARTDGTPFPCNYPPVALYLLTGTQWLRMHGEWASRTRAGAELIKLPNLLAVLAAAAVVWAGLAPVVGRAEASATARRVLFCGPLLVNAALWGQYDALVTAAMVTAMVLALRDRPTWAGACLGAALAVKVQAVVAIPALVVYTARRTGFAAVGRATGAAVLVVGLAAAPVVAGGGGRGVWRSYAGALDYVPQVSVYAANPWQAVLQYRTHVRHLPLAAADSDATPVLGPVTAKQLGLAAVAAYTLALMAGLWRRPDRHTFALAAALTAFGFFLLPTQIHERYALPAVALLVPIAARGHRRPYAALAAAATVNQLVVIAASNLRFDHAFTPRAAAVQDTLLLALIPVNVAAVAWLTVQFFRRVYAERPTAAWRGAAGPVSGGSARR